MTIEANITSNFTSPAFSSTIYPDESQYKYDFIYNPITSNNYRYWRFTFNESIGASFTEVGKIFLGSAVSLIDDDMNLGWEFYKNDLSKITKNESGQKFVDIIGKQNILKGSFKYLNLANLQTLEYLGEEHSVVKPLWIVLDSDEVVVSEMEKNAMRCYMTNIIKENNVRPKLYDLSIEFEEAK